MSQGQYFEADHVTPEQLDTLWAFGWRHFGTYFFRYWSNYTPKGLCHVMPLRLELAKFQPSDSQRRISRKNSDLRVEIRETDITDEIEALFFRHRQRFTHNVPESIHTFLSFYPATIPCENREIAVYDGDRLVAVSFLDVGHKATSSVYGVFDPDYSKRSLGIFTMLEEIRFSRERGGTYYYPGYAYREPSHYDYKKRFRGLEFFDWEGGWNPLPDEEKS